MVLLSLVGRVDRLLDAILDICGCPPEKFRSICSAIDKLDKLEWSEVGWVSVPWNALLVALRCTDDCSSSCLFVGAVAAGTPQPPSAPLYLLT